MEINATIIEELSNGNSLCKLCVSYLTLGKNDEIKRDNLHIHFNGRKHKFRYRMFEKSFYTEDSDKSYDDGNGVDGSFERRFSLKSNSLDVCFLYENGISCDIKHHFNFYCSYCDCELPQLSKDKNSNIYNITVHVTSKRHILNVLWHYSRCLIDNKRENIIWVQNDEPFLKIQKVHTTITAAVHLNDKFLTVDEMFSNIPDHLQHHRASVSSYDTIFYKFKCSFCDCVVGVSNKKFKTVNNLLCHIQGRKHLRFFKKLCYGNSYKTVSFDEVEDSNLLKIMKMTKNRIINKNEIYIHRNSNDNIICSLCKCVLPDVGKGGYLLAIKNFEIHFSGKRHCRILRQNSKHEINKNIKSDDRKCDELVLKLFNELPSSVSKSHVNYFIISKTMNLVCKICSCIIYRNIEFSGPSQPILSSLKTHIQSRKHSEKFDFKEGLKSYNDITLKLKKSAGVKNDCQVSSSCDSSQNVIKLDSCGQLVCSLCHKIIAPKNCELDVAVMSHLRGKMHKCKNAMLSNELTENMLVDIINSLPKDYKINIKFLSFVFKFGIINCSICNYMFTVNSNYGLRNNLMIHIMSRKHKNILSMTPVIDDVVDDDVCKSREMINEYYSLAIKNPESELCPGFETDFSDNDFSLLLDVADDEYLEFVFRNYIPKNLVSNKKYVSLKSNKIFCISCNRPITNLMKNSDGVLSLINHFIGDLHKKKLKKYKITEFYKTFQLKKFTVNCLNRMFKNHIPKKWLSHRNHIKIISNKLYCVLCQCNLLIGENSSCEVVVRELKLHFQKTDHDVVFKNLEEEAYSEKLVNSELITKEIGYNVGEKEYVSELFCNFITENLRCNKEYLTYNKNLKRLNCHLCNIFVSVAKCPEATAKNVMVHLEGNVHSRNIKKGKAIEEQSNISNFNSEFKVTVSDKEYLNNICNYIFTDLKFNIQCIFYKKSIGLFCHVCSCKISDQLEPINVARNVIDHFSDIAHKSNLIKLNKIEAAGVLNGNDDCIGTDFLLNFQKLFENESYIIDVLFSYFIPEDLHFNQQYISADSSKIECQLCNSKIIYVSLQATAQNLKSHLRGISHQVRLNDARKFLETQNCTAKAAVINPWNFASTAITNNNNTLTNRIIMNCSAASSPISINNTSPTLSASNSMDACSISSNDGNKSKITEELQKNFNKLKDHFCANNNNPRENFDDEEFQTCISQDGLSPASTILNHVQKSSQVLTLEYRGVGNGDESANLNVSCDMQSGHMDKYSEKFINEVFAQFIPQDFQDDRQYICVKHDKVVCSVCDLTLGISDNPKISGNVLLKHIKGSRHSKKVNGKVKTMNKNVEKWKDHSCASNSNPKKNFADDEFQTCISQDDLSPASTILNHVQISSQVSKLENRCVTNVDEAVILNSACEKQSKHLDRYSEKFFDKVFAEFIPQDFQYNRQYICVKQDKVHCRVCNLTLSLSDNPKITAKELMGHTKGSRHLKKVKTMNENVENCKDNFLTSKSNHREKSVDDEFQTYISQEVLSSSSTILDHVQKSSQVLTLEYRGVGNGDESANLNVSCDMQSRHMDKYSEKFINEVFAQFIPHDFQDDRQYICVKHDKVVCSVCDLTLGISDNPKISGNVLFEHIKGSRHSKKVNGKVKTMNKNVEKWKDHSCASNSNPRENYLDDKFHTCNTQDILSSASKILNHVQITSQVSTLENKGATNIDESVSLNSACGKKSKHMDRYSEKFYDKVFAEFIPQDFQYNRQYICVKRDKVYCSVCNLTLSLSVDPNITAKELMVHIKGSKHKSKEKTMNINDPILTDKPCVNNNNSDEKSSDDEFHESVNIYSACDKESNHMGNYSEKFIDEVFAKFIPQDFQCNRQYFCIKLDMVFCSACNFMLFGEDIPQIAANQIMEHVKEFIHVESTKTRIVNDINLTDKPCVKDEVNPFEKTIDDVFEKYIPSNLQCNRQFLVVKQNELVCSVCDCCIPKGKSLQSTEKNILYHVKGSSHLKNLNKRPIGSVGKSVNYNSACDNQSNHVDKYSEKFIDEVFSKLIPHDFQDNRQCISVKRDKVNCIVCNLSILNVSDNPKITANELMVHIKGSKHKSKVKTMNTNDPIFTDKPYINNNKSDEKSLDDEFQTCIPENSLISASTILNHVNGSSHMKTLVKRTAENDEAANKYSSWGKPRKRTCHVSEKFLDEVFAEFISHDFESSRQYIIIKDNKLECNVCNCTLMITVDNHLVTSNVLLEHIKGPNHKLSVKTRIENDVKLTDKPFLKDNSYEKFLDEVFDTCIPQDVQFNRQFFIVDQDKLTCNICSCSLSKFTSIFSAASTILNHITGSIHVATLNK